VCVCVCVCVCVRCVCVCVCVNRWLVALENIFFLEFVRCGYIYHLLEFVVAIRVCV